jgi:integral membrane protein
MAMVTGSMLLLLTVEMVLKYVFQVNGVGESGRAPAGDRHVGGDHPRWIYVVYAVTVFQLWSFMRWSLTRLLVLILGGVVPVLSFVMEARARHWFAADLPARLDRAERLAAAGGAA